MSFLPFTRPSIDEETIAGVAEVLRSGWIASGPQVQAFEAAFSAYLGGRLVRTFTSATGALEVALQVCGIGPGDEVIVPAMTFAATANVVLRVGARPVLVDVDPVTRNIDLERAESAITPRTRAIMPVHFAGLPVNLDDLYDLARRRGVRVVEDAAHAAGARWRGRKIGSVGDLVVFSFHPNKNMTTIEGGAISYGDPALTRPIELHRFHGLDRDGVGNMEVSVAGGKYNLSDVAARVGIGQLQRLDEFNDKRRALAHRYLRQLHCDPPLELPTPGDAGHCWHLFAPLLPLAQLRIGRPEFIELMRGRDVGIGVHYPALHLFALYRKLGYEPGDCPHAARIGQSTVSLPLFPAMTEADVDRVSQATSEVLHHGSLSRKTA
jgi:dTDP-4-amino-4,6-dideoxygalactose transaminase